MSYWHCGFLLSLFMYSFEYRILLLHSLNKSSSFASFANLNRERGR